MSTPSTPPTGGPGTTVLGAGVHRVYVSAFALGVALMVVGFAAGAFESLRTEHRLPGIGVPVYGAAEQVEALIGRKDYGGAVRQLQLYAKTSNDRLPHEKLSAIFSRSGPEVRAGVEEALRGEDYAEGEYRVGVVYAAEDDLTKAAAHFEHALQLQPGRADVHNTLGVVLARQGRVQEAAVHFRQAVSLDAANADARANLDKALQLLESQASGAP